MTKTELQYLIALTLVDGVGPIIGKELLHFFGSAENIFRESPTALRALKNVGPALAESVQQKKSLSKAAAELEFIEANDITVISITESHYPANLKNCVDAPIVLYYKGNGKLNEQRSVSIVGTRDCTHYGRKFVEELIEILSEQEIAVHSGLAYGIDITAHKSSMENGIPTYCSLAHGLDRIYPHRHRGLANKMLKMGVGLLNLCPVRYRIVKTFPKEIELWLGFPKQLL
ncbi:MAG: DNA-protecting protein DprA [Flavobacteriales bacterium]|nr:DNA-protecting protein DprA [Flavobacteriales bacterium]